MNLKPFYLLFLTFLFATCSSPKLDKNAFYVSLTGNDIWSGTSADVNETKTDGPFRTLQKAQEAIRELKSTNTWPQNGMTVYIRGGEYVMEKGLELLDQDSGTETAPVKWKAFPGEKVVFSGGKVIDNFKSITDPKILKRVSESAQKNILVADLFAKGIADFGIVQKRSSIGLELFYKNERMYMARYPNEGWLKIADIPQYGPKRYNEGLEREKRFDGVPVGRHYGKIKYDDNRPANWSGDNEIYMQGYWTWDWNDSFEKVKKIDKKRQLVYFEEPFHHYGYTKNQRYYYMNILEELDSPGEWVLNREAGLLYFWPPDSFKTGDMVVSLLTDPFVTMKGCENVLFENIQFAFSRGNGIVMEDGKNNKIAGCQFYCLGDHAVLIKGGSNNGVTSSDIYQVALGGIYINSGDRASLTPAGNYAVNNHIHHYSNLVRTYQWAIDVTGVGNLVAHNHIHDAPHEAMHVSGNEHIIEYNDVHDVVKETGDSGALHTGRDWTWRGNIIRYNYWHHLTGAGLHGVMGVYLDDFSSDFTVYGNVFYKAGRATLVGGGRDNVVENNIYIDCHPSIHLDARGLSWAHYYFTGKYPVLFEKMDEMNYSKPPYSEKYPKLLELYSDDPAVPKGNVVRRNISYGGRWLDVYDFLDFDFSVVTMEDNIIADDDVWRRRNKDQTGPDPYYLNIDIQEGYDLLKNDENIGKELKNNIFVKGNPGFENIEQEDFRLTKASRAKEIGFEPIPFDKIGLYKDEYRKVID